MIPLEYALLVLGALCGYLVWRRRSKLLHSILAAIAIPMIVLAAIRGFVDYAVLQSIVRVEFEIVLKTILLSGVIVALCTVVYVHREK